jgi:hypothetical protein
VFRRANSGSSQENRDTTREAKAQVPRFAAKSLAGRESTVRNPRSECGSLPKSPSLSGILECTVARQAVSRESGVFANRGFSYRVLDCTGSVHEKWSASLSRLDACFTMPQNTLLEGCIIVPQEGYAPSESHYSSCLCLTTWNSCFTTMLHRFSGSAYLRSCSPGRPQTPEPGCSSC